VTQSPATIGRPRLREVYEPVLRGEPRHQHRRTLESSRRCASTARTVDVDLVLTTGWCPFRRHHVPSSIPRTGPARSSTAWRTVDVHGSSGDSGVGPRSALSRPRREDALSNAARKSSSPTRQQRIAPRSLIKWPLTHRPPARQTAPRAQRSTAFVFRTCVFATSFKLSIRPTGDRAFRGQMFDEHLFAFHQLPGPKGRREDPLARGVT